MERIEKRFRRDGMTFCTFVSERMETGIARADELYRRFCESAQKYAEDVVAKDAMLRYDADENPRKRFRFPHRRARVGFLSIGRRTRFPWRGNVSLWERSFGTFAIRGT